MNLLEYEGKRLLAEAGVPVPQSVETIGSQTKPLAYPVVLKSQVPVGGRGKLGGIRIVENEAEYIAAAEEIMDLEIKGYTPRLLLTEEKLDIRRELYLSLLINRQTEEIQLVTHPDGGVEVEDNDSDDFLRRNLEGDLGFVGEELAEFYGAPEVSFALQDLVENLRRCFFKNEATLIEINPLVITGDNRLIAGDCKMVLDGAAAFRHPDWDFEQQNTDNNFVTLDDQGTVATIANGAGLAMATVDAVTDFDMKPANFLDIGGGASAESVLAAFEKILEYQNVQAIVINIFAGITRCDEVAKAIISARQQITNLPSLHIRLAGNNYLAAKELLDAEGISLLPTLADCLNSAKEAIK